MPLLHMGDAYIMKHMILKAEHHNWGMLGSGDWESTEYIFYEDCHVDIFSIYRGDSFSDSPVKDSIKKDILRFNYFKLLSLIEEARNCSTHQDAYDGDAWKFIFYKEGKILRKTKIGYIYDVSPLESLAAYCRNVYSTNREIRY